MVRPVRSSLQSSAMDGRGTAKIAKLSNTGRKHTRSIKLLSSVEVYFGYSSGVRRVSLSQVSGY
jgi:hypothetical protein